jgi:ATP-dependent Clp protease ATP-binding subunit ClpB
VHARGGVNENLRQKLLDSLKQSFRPEFLNRIDDTIVFNPLTKEHLYQIIDIQLVRVGRLLKEKGLSFELTSGAREVLMAEGYEPQYGARPLRRTIQRMVQDPLALKLLNGEFREGDTVLIDGDVAARTLQFERRAVELVGQ